jgi:hypothetical protein
MNCPAKERTPKRPRKGSGRRSGLVNHSRFCHTFRFNKQQNNLLPNKGEA